MGETTASHLPVRILRTCPAWQALDAGSSLSDEIRRGELLAIVDAVAELSTQVTTLQELKDMFAAGRLRQFVHKNARALLRSP
ncbi:hypothetical protein [Cellulomonas xiejunii]|uniref:hypothetical protein n=1 Tax=Cellulomonas xiejunii TaxID=2968083 RepID=UPI001D0EF17B|nr:hypothetical protein [Cellulomonas xiejunii]MCC2316090.1 hypothetical protein [Cellulomonas xiejunii]